MPCHLCSWARWRSTIVSRSSVKSVSRISKPVTCSSVRWACRTQSRTVNLRWSPCETMWASQIVAVQPQLKPCCNQCRGKCRSRMAGRSICCISDKSTTKSSMRSVVIASSSFMRFSMPENSAFAYLITRMGRVEEVLQQQPESIQTFLLRTSILDRLCGSLCDAVLLNPSVSGQATLEYLERANLFLVPLDNERRWYRYHHLFADLLRQRLHQSAASSMRDERKGVAELHIRASQWYEDNGLEIEAFHHAVAANDIERAERLIEGEGVPLHFRGAGAPVRNWLESLPTAVLNARPSLWVTYASALMTTGQTTAVEQKLQAAETALQGTEPDDRTTDLVGRIASMRATLAVIQHNVETIITQSRRALEYLDPDNLPVRTATTWTLGYAYQLQGDRAAASQAYAEVISIGKSFGDSIYTLAATINLGQVQEADNQLYLAAESYRRSLQLAGDPPQRMACDAHLGLARVLYEWNDLEAALAHGQQSAQLAPQILVDTFAAYEVFVAR